MRLRFAMPEDAPRLLEIYIPYVEESVVSFEYKAPSVSDFRDRINIIQKNYPFLVCEIDERIIGYAYAQQYKERAAYQWNVELSLYLDPSSTKQHCGSMLMQALLNILHLQHIQNAYSCITMPNPASEAIHRRFGFALVGTFHKCGYKFDNWYDVIWMEKALQCYKNPPEAWLSIEKLHRADIEFILKQPYSS